MKKNTYTVMGRFPGHLVQLDYRKKGEKKYTRYHKYEFEKEKAKAYVIEDYLLIFSDISYKKGQKIKIPLYHPINNIIVKSLRYIRITNDKYNGQPYIHHFTGKEKLFYIKALDNRGSNMIYLLSSNRKLAVIEEE